VALENRIPIEALLNGQSPELVGAPQPNVPPPPAGLLSGMGMPSSPLNPADREQVLRQLALLLLEIPELRAMIAQELAKLKMADALPPRPGTPPPPPPASGPASSFADKLRQLRQGG